MKQLVGAVMAAVVLAGCAGGGGNAGESASEAAAPSSAETSSAESSTAEVQITCTAGGLDAMAALADFQLEMDDAQKSGKITLEQLTSAREKLFNDTQAAQEKEDWTAYCKAIDDTRAELGL